MRSRILVGRKRLRPAVSAATVALPPAFASLLSCDCRRCGAPRGGISALPVYPGCLCATPGIADETRSCPEPALNPLGAFELAHLKQVAAGLVLLPENVLRPGTAAFERAPVLRKAGALWAPTVARQLKVHAIAFEARPEEEVARRAQ